MKISPKHQFVILSWITLVVFSIIGLLLLLFLKDRSILDVLELSKINHPINLIGLELGFTYAFLVILVSQAPIFENVSNQQAYMIKSMNLSWGIIIFASFCAGFGEEILFRAAIQSWVGPILTSILFIVVHGYIHPLSWRKSLLSVLLLPFILLIAYSYIAFGLWFCIAAHFAYDLLMFVASTKFD